MEWKHRGVSQNYEQYVLSETGKTMNKFMDVFKQYNISGFDKIKEVLLRAKKENILITIVSDYDCDGICSSMILASLCKELGIRYVIIIPKRISEGYGLSPKIMERINEGIVLTVDNGIKAFEAIEIAKSKGLEVIIMDHHLADDKIPNADIIVDPSAFPDTADFAHYCGAGLAFKFSQYMLGDNHPLCKLLNGIAAIATIGDSVPLIGDNRKIVIEGLNAIKEGYATKGMQSLFELCKIDNFSTAETYAYNLVPCINAPGRLYDDGGKIALQTIWSNGNKSEELAKKLSEINELRKEKVEEIMKSIVLEDFEKDNFVFYYNPLMQEGLAGLIAGKLAELTQKPTLAMTKTHSGFIKGSCRNQEATIHLKNILNKCSDLLVAYGGHPKAAAMTFEEKNINYFKERLSTLFPKIEIDDALFYDFEIKASELIDLSEKLDLMEPFGEGNRKPVVMIKNLKIGDYYGNQIQFMGKDDNKPHVKFCFKKFKAVGFNLAEKYLEETAKLEKTPEYFDLLGYVEKNYYNGKVYPQFRLIDFKISS